jgi:glutamate---cysteine ligase / carboxylate-amine ligase
MPLNDPPFTIGIEEEYFFVDRETRNLAVDPPATMMADCAAQLTGQVSPEFLRAQIEVETRVCTSVAEARADLAHLRSTVASVANNHGLGLIAAATHPFAKWNDQQHTDKERYNELAQDMQALARRLLICGLHVHVGIEDDDLRIDLMNQVRYFLPHLLALSTSSPFWGGEDSGLLSYRLSVFDAMPRSGLPEVFDSAAEYDRLVAQMVNANVIEDATKFWWDVRPSARYPTLEMRITDVCTRLDDSIAIAALYVCILSMLYRLRKSNLRWRIYPRTMINENRWLAQRYGVTGTMVDFGIGRPVAYADLLDEVIELVREDAERMDCVAEIEHAREIVRRGTSAQSQQQVYQEAITAGADPQEALKGVVDMLIEETTVGL